MERQEFEQLVARLEVEAARDPERYRTRVRLLAFLGYAYVIIALIGAIALAVLSIALVKLSFLSIKFIWFLLVLIGVILRSLWVKVGAPEGIEITTSQAPALFAEVEAIRKDLECEPIHHVLVTDEFNAGVSQVPRFGLIGRATNYLAIGLPLMQALSPDQFRAVLAHELGHISEAHGTFGQKIYRLRATWSRLLAELEQKRHSGAALFRRFLKWYAPFFNAYTFVLARANEYEADRWSARVAGSRTAADALISLRVKGAMLAQEFWPSVRERVRQEPEPPANVHRLMDLRQSGSRAEEWLQMGLQRQTSVEDTHPSLQERLRALSEEARVPPPLGETAAERYLEPSLSLLVDRIDAEWRSQIREAWTKRHQEARKALQRLSELDATSRLEPLSPEEALERAGLTESLVSARAALPLYREALGLAPDHPVANFGLGQALLAEGDDAGIAYLEKAMSLDPDAVIPGCEWIYRFYMARSEEDRARPYLDRAVQQQERLNESKVERNRATVKDRYLPHGLSEDQLAPIRSVLAQVPGLRRAYLVRKEVKQFPEKPMHVLVVLHGRWWQKVDQVENKKVLATLRGKVPFPGTGYYVVHGRADPRIKKIRKVPGAQILPGSRR